MNRDRQRLDKMRLLRNLANGQSRDVSQNDVEAVEGLDDFFEPVETLGLYFWVPAPTVKTRLNRWDTNIEEFSHGFSDVLKYLKFSKDDVQKYLTHIVSREDELEHNDWRGIFLVDKWGNHRGCKGYGRAKGKGKGGQRVAQNIPNVFPNSCTEWKHIVPLFVAVQRGLDLSNIDFCITGAVLNFLSSRVLDDDETTYLAQKLGNVTVISKTKDYDDDKANEGQQWQRIIKNGCRKERATHTDRIQPSNLHVLKIG